MKNFQRIAQGVDVMPLLLALQRQPHLWNKESMRKDWVDGPHAGMEDIWVRFNDLNKVPYLSKMNDEHDSVWYPAFYNLPELRPIIFSLMGRVEGERLGGVLITKIPPGGKILPHKDDSWHVRYYDKYYVSIKNPPESRFFCEDEVITPQQGEVWWFDNTREHWVENNGNDDRITLIICIRNHRYEDRHVVR